MIRFKPIALLCAAAHLIFALSLAADEPAPAKPADLKRPLRQILIAESIDAAQGLSPVPNGGFVVCAPSLAISDLGELSKRLAAGENQLIDEKLLAAIAQVVENFARQHDFPTAIAVIPPQAISEGAVRVALMLKPTPLRKILISDSAESAQQVAPGAESDFVVLAPSLSFIDHTAITKQVAGAQNQVIQEHLLAAVAQSVEIYLRQHDYPVATAAIASKDTTDGVVRVAVQLGKVRNITLAGNRWFSESLLLQKLRMERGGVLRASDLTQAIDWTNNNPYRHVRVQINPVANSDQADVIVAVQEALPLRLTAVYDNNGNEVIGKDRYTASLSYANLWGKDHLASYQFITTNLGPTIFQAHGIDYRVPLPWRHFLQFSSSYVKAKPTFLGGLFAQKGENLNAELRYTMPIRGGNNPAEAFAGVAFKESNNNLTFDPSFNKVEVLATKTDIFQAFFGASTVRHDSRGAWALGANLVVSPGGINSRNSDEAFDASRFNRGDSSRFGAKASYVYGSLTIQRLLTLERGWEFFSRGVMQLASANLLSSEQLAVGGSASVRGFNENIFAGDNGFAFSNDLMAPAWKTNLPFVSKKMPALETRLLAFYDAGNVGVVHRYLTDPARRPLASTGFGLRVNLATNFSLTADYGWQITHLPYAVAEHSRGHIKVTLAY